MCVTNFAFSQVTLNNDLEKLHLKDKVKSITSAHYSTFRNTSGVVPHAPEMPKLYTFKTTYNKLGHVVHTEFIVGYNKNIKLNKSKYKYEHIYDSKNNLIEKTSRKIAGSDESDDDTKSVDKFFYNDKNQMINAIMNSNSSEVYLLIYEYDEKGNQFLMKTYNRTDQVDETKLSSKDYFTYNEKRNIIKKEHFNSDNLRENIESFKYDENNHILVREYEYFNGYANNNKKQPLYWAEPTITYKYILDKNKNWISLTAYIDGKTPVTTTQKIKYY
jgi:hypothetical protein